MREFSDRWLFCFRARIFNFTAMRLLHLAYCVAINILRNPVEVKIWRQQLFRPIISFINIQILKPHSYFKRLVQPDGAISNIWAISYILQKQQNINYINLGVVITQDGPTKFGRFFFYLIVEILAREISRKTAPEKEVHNNSTVHTPSCKLPLFMHFNFTIASQFRKFVFITLTLSQLKTSIKIFILFTYF